jgi:hypothetical protein
MGNSREVKLPAVSFHPAKAGLLNLTHTTQQEKDLYLSTVLGTPPTAEADCFGRDEHEPEPERDRGRHL